MNSFVLFDQYFWTAIHLLNYKIIWMNFFTGVRIFLFPLLSLENFDDGKVFGRIKVVAMIQVFQATSYNLLKFCDPDSVPNIHQLLLIACTLPITSAEAERSFSLLRRMRSYTRSTINEQKFSDLAIYNNAL